MDFILECSAGPARSTVESVRTRESKDASVGALGDESIGVDTGPRSKILYQRYQRTRAKSALSSLFGRLLLAA